MSDNITHIFLFWPTSLQVKTSIRSNWQIRSDQLPTIIITTTWPTSLNIYSDTYIFLFWRPLLQVKTSSRPTWQIRSDQLPIVIIITTTWPTRLNIYSDNYIFLFWSLLLQVKTSSRLNWQITSDQLSIINSSSLSSPPLDQQVQTFNQTLIYSSFSHHRCRWRPAAGPTDR